MYISADRWPSSSLIRPSDMPEFLMVLKIIHGGPLAAVAYVVLAGNCEVQMSKNTFFFVATCVSGKSVTFFHSKQDVAMYI